MGKMVVAAVIVLWIVPVSILVNQIVPDAYMDEIFHVPQAQRYCEGNFRSWDPMITTPPGLYYLSLVYVAFLTPGMWCLNSTLSFSDICSTAVLRSANGFLALICSLVMYDIFTCLRPTLSERRATFYTIVLALYPVHWFFTFLYYTDIASLAAALAMYLACLKKHYWLSSLLGGLATFIRQTNIIWMVFVAGVGIIRFSETRDTMHYRRSRSLRFSGKNNELSDRHSISVLSNMRKRRMGGPAEPRDLFLSRVSSDAVRACSSNSPSGLLIEIQDVLLPLYCYKQEFIVSFAPFMLVLIAFVFFLILNGSIVLGAKESHSISPHFPQIFYFGFVSAAFMGPVHFSFGQAVTLLQLFFKNKLLCSLLMIMGLSVGLLSVHFFSIAHPYLLADNRHYTFYIWRIINGHWLTVYLLVPLYVYSWMSILTTLGRGQKMAWVLLFFLACGAVLIPAPLIEFRYYTIPFYLVILHSHMDDNKGWKHEPGVQRFIW